MRIALAFASGSAGKNRAMLGHLRARHPALTLYVVSEFMPEDGHWIPWHVKRTVAENRKAILAEIADHEIAASAVVFDDSAALGKMRLAAFLIAPQHLAVYGLPEYLAHSGRPAVRWLKGIAHPSEMELPLRARTAQLFGIAASGLRRPLRETPLAGRNALLEGISIVVPSRDGRELLEAMLPPLLAQFSSAVDRYETIVVDNGSRDASADWLRQTYPAIKIVESKTALSFAKAVNAGLALARRRRLLLLNNDMVVEAGFVSALDSAFDRVPDLFCATAQIFFPPGARREETGKAVWRRENPLDFPVRCDEPVAGEDLTWVLYGSGGCSLYDTAKLLAIGGVPEIYDPAYVEDMDLGYRAWKRGWPSVFRAGAKVEHRHRATTSRFFTPRELDVFVERNYLNFLVHAIGAPDLFRELWRDAIRRLHLLQSIEVLRGVPRIGPSPPVASGPLTEREILALGNGDIAIFPSRAGRGNPPVLIASPYLPFPLSHGGAVRIFNLMKHTADRQDLVLMAFCDALDAPPEELLDICAEIVLVRRRGSHYRRDTELPDVVEEFDSPTFRACLKQTAARWKPVAIQLEFTWMAQYADAYRGAKTILVEHDITFDLQRQLLDTGNETGAARLELETQFDKWRRFETAAWRLVDCVVTMSRKDAEALTGAKEVVVVPNGVDCKRFRPRAARSGSACRRLLFIGSFAHLPNLLALEFFVRDVWPKLGGGYTLHVIAGARPEYYLDFHRRRVTVDLAQPGIELEGFVADVRDAYSRACMAIAPLTASAGTNIKVLEAMAMGKVVIGTKAGINGLELHPGEDVILADAAADFAAAIESIANDGARRARMETAARRTAEEFDWARIAARQRYSGDGEQAIWPKAK